MTGQFNDLHSISFCRITLFIICISSPRMLQFLMYFVHPSYQCCICIYYDPVQLLPETTKSSICILHGWPTSLFRKMCCFAKQNLNLIFSDMVNDTSSDRTDLIIKAYVSLVYSFVLYKYLQLLCLQTICRFQDTQKQIWKW